MTRNPQILTVRAVSIGLKDWKNNTCNYKRKSINHGHISMGTAAIASVRDMFQTWKNFLQILRRCITDSMSMKRCAARTNDWHKQNLHKMALFFMECIEYCDLISVIIKNNLIFEFNSHWAGSFQDHLKFCNIWILKQGRS